MLKFVLRLQMEEERNEIANGENGETILNHEAQAGLGVSVFEDTACVNHLTGWCFQPCKLKTAYSHWIQVAGNTLSQRNVGSMQGNSHCALFDIAEIYVGSHCANSGIQVEEILSADLYQCSIRLATPVRYAMYSIESMVWIADGLLTGTDGETHLNVV